MRIPSEALQEGNLESKETRKKLQLPGCQRIRIGRLQGDGRNVKDPASWRKLRTGMYSGEQKKTKTTLRWG